MLERLTETFIAGVELLEAEGRAVRDQATKIGQNALMMLLSGLAGLAGLIMASIGVTWVLADAIGIGGALAVVGTLLMIIGAAGAHITQRRNDPIEAYDPPIGDDDSPEGVFLREFPQ